VYSVPFENLQLHRKNKSISLSTNDLFTKIVTKRQGGFCYEINGLFGALLRQLGYNVEFVGASVASRGEEDSKTLQFTAGGASCFALSPRAD
jgi:N-hydroxyarylamine O-acetyltransferase